MNLEAAKTWEGQIVDGKFPLRCWLGGSDHSAVFLTEMASAKAVIKLVVAGTLDANLQLLRWQQATQLSHPHLVRLLTQGRCQIGGAPFLYLVMEYADENLAEILLQRALTAGETKDLLQSVLEALAYLHGKGLVHGQVQPSNILAQGNQVKLSADCIRASGQAGEGSQRRISVYDAPELRTGVLSPAVDVWSLGATVVAALTQRPGAYEATGRKADIAETVPEPFRSITRDCLRPDPRQRCTIADIKSRLMIGPSMTAAPTAAESKPPRVRLLIPVAAILLLAALFLGPKLLSRHGGTSTENPGKTEPLPAQPVAPPPAAQTANSTPAKTASRGEVARQVLPVVPQSARNTIQGKVRVAVRLRVDPSGKVSSATLASAGPSKYFAKLALNAAQQWQFTPPQENGQPSPSTWLLRFQFGRTGTQVFPAQERN